MIKNTPYFICILLVCLLLVSISMFADEQRETEPPKTWLFTAGPCNVSPDVKEAMKTDYDSRGSKFAALNQAVLTKLKKLIGDQNNYAVIPIQGSGTFATEAMLGTFAPKEGRGVLLVLSNGEFGNRMATIANKLGRRTMHISYPEEKPIPVAILHEILTFNPNITHVAVVHGETSTGMLNPLKEIAETVKHHKRILLVDAMSSFGAIPIDSKDIPFDALVTSSNKALHGVPGIGIVFANKDALSKTKNNSPSYSLDLFEQNDKMENSGQWRFTPPTYAVSALHAALDELEKMGGVEARHAQYIENAKILRAGMRRLGFMQYLPDSLIAPMATTFLTPQKSNFDTAVFREKMLELGFSISSGKSEITDTFRVGVMGDITPSIVKEFIQAAETTLKEMDVVL